MIGVLAQIYTDGACRGNPGVGGWGVILFSGSEERELSGSEEHTTNNRMELMAAIQGLRMLEEESSIVLYTDSQYVCKGITDWMPNWKRRGWKTASGHLVKNRDLWQELDLLRAQHAIEWRWIKGHTGNPGNERADALANLAIDRFLETA
ncbi:MAG: ribonuclease HI [Acidiferrobacteraceae bacterium]|nr:ribonuclease HI [Acidiferrobacteraceae bacterium]